MSAPVPIVGLTPEQVAVRAQGIGASECAAALGLSKRTSAVELWALKTGREPPTQDDAFLRLGNAAEAYIIGEYVRDTHTTKIEVKPDTLRRGRQIAHCDAITPAAVIEAKWRGSREGWGEPKSSDIPTDVYMQTVQQMDLAGRELAHVPVLFMRPPIVIYEVAFDAELAQMIADGVGEFWRYVERDEPPPIDPDHPRALQMLRLVHKGTNGQRIVADAELEAWRIAMESSRELASEYGKSADNMKAHILRRMGDNAELAFADGRVMRRSLIRRKGYAVADTEFIEARIVKG
ncbi:MAG: YqaJ viral recombinase family protein [Deltaproteobacteria bacterium]|nr:YqaJ viral recombinase family protein [Deltaproteobacteria bacterium]